MRIDVRADVAAATRMLTNLQQRQIPYATAVALTRTAQDVQAAETAEIERVIDRPTPFTKRAVGLNRATKGRLRAEVFLKDVQAAYLRLQITGGTRTPKRRAIVIPEGLAVNQYGNMPRNAIKRLLARKDVFSGTVRGVPGIWQRLKAGGLKLLVAYEPTAQYRAIYDFHGVGQRTARSVFAAHMQRELARAIATAR